jgi:hypothetical protein
VRPSQWALHLAEVVYLVAAGWRPTAPLRVTLWDEPRRPWRRGLTKGHAVNCQKQYDRQRAGGRFVP